MKVAVVSMPAIFADTVTNMKLAEEYIRGASTEGASLICLPEFFNTGFAVDSKLIKAIQNKLDIELQLSALSSKYNIAIGGSYLNYDRLKNNIFNTYGLFFPDGQVFTHSKDIPTALENFCYTYGDTTSAFDTPLGRIGVVMCWEQLRYDTVKRMYGKVDLLVGGSCWWGFTPEDGAVTYKLLADYNKSLAQNAPARLASIMGVPFIHSSHIGNFAGASMSNPPVTCNRHIESKTVICDAQGEYILNASDKPGCYICDVTPGCIKKEGNPQFPDTYWIPELPPELENGFNMLNKKYHEIYKQVILNFETT